MSFENTGRAAPLREAARHDGHLYGGDRGWDITACWLEQHGVGAELILVEPGHDGGCHDAIIPEAMGEAGGPRGWATPLMISMMIMRPPQHGHSGR